MEIYRGFASVAFMGNLNRKTAIALIPGKLQTKLNRYYSVQGSRMKPSITISCIMTGTEEQ